MEPEKWVNKLHWSSETDVVHNVDQGEISKILDDKIAQKRIKYTKVQIQHNKNQVKRFLAPTKEP